MHLTSPSALCRRSAEMLRKGWRTVEAFLVDYYRACGTTAVPMAPRAGRRFRLQPREVLTLVEAHGARTLEVARGEIWLTQTPANKDLLLGGGTRFDLGDGFPVVIEALQATEVVLRT